MFSCTCRGPEEETRENRNILILIAFPEPIRLSYNSYCAWALFLGPRLLSLIGQLSLKPVV